MKRPALLSGLFLLVITGLTLTLAQNYRYDYRAGVPDWEPDAEFAEDVFTFVRIRWSSGGIGYDRYNGQRSRRGRGGDWRGRGGWGGGWGAWDTDYPDSDLNFSYRLQQLTAMEVNCCCS